MISKLVLIIKNFPGNPFKMPELPNEEKKLNSEDSSTQLRTEMLEKIKYKICNLIRVEYGKAGSEIITKSLLTPGMAINLFLPVKKIKQFFLN